MNNIMYFVFGDDSKGKNGAITCAVKTINNVIIVGFIITNPRERLDIELAKQEAEKNIDTHDPSKRVIFTNQFITNASEDLLNRTKITLMSSFACNKNIPDWVKELKFLYLINASNKEE